MPVRASGDVIAATLSEVLAARAATAPEADAVIGLGRAWTYRDLADCARAAPPAAGSRVAIEADDPFSLAVASVIVAARHAAVPMPDDLPPAARAEVLARLSPVEVATADAILAGEWRSTVTGAEPTLDDVALVLMTSGSTGRPKLVPNTYRNLWASARGTRERQLLYPGDRILTLGAIAHALGIRMVTDALWCGAAAVVADDLGVTTVRRTLAELRPTSVVCTPPSLRVLAVAFEGLGPDEQAAVAETVRFVRCGSALAPAALVDRVKELFDCPILQGYGLSEAAKISLASSDGSSPRGSSGPLVGGIEVWLDGGEICVRGDSVAPGYLDDEHRSASVFVDGWFRTGDLGRFDDDGNLYVLGRRDDVVSRGGELVSLAAVERAVQDHPGVESALAAAVDHPTLGTDVVVAYTPRDDGPAPGELHAYLGTRLPASQVPTRLAAVDELPLTASRKPSRRALAALFEARAEAAVTPDLDATELQLAAFWREVLGIDAVIAADTDFFAFGGSSLQLLELCSIVSDRLGAALMPAHVIAEPTLRGMAGAVRSLTGHARRPVLIPLRRGRPGPLRLYVVPGAGGTLAALQRIVFDIGHGRRVLGFEAPGLYGGERPLKRVTDLARCYVDELLADHDGEPFAVLGTSYGSVVAQEMTAQLEAKGIPPALLILIDGPAPGRVALRRRLVRGTKRALRWRPTARTPVGGLRPRVQRHLVASRRAMTAHRPRPTTTETVLVSSAHMRTQTGDPLLRWGPHLRGEVTTLEHGGRHVELMQRRTAEYVPELDRLLARHDPPEPADTVGAVPIAVSLAGPDDADELVEAFARLVPQLSTSNPPPDRAAVDAMLASPVTSQFVARGEDGKIVGVATLAVFRIPTALRAWIEDVITDESARGQGIGEALTRAMLDRARELGCATVDLTSRPSREAANRLYKRVGFEQRETNVYRFTRE